MLKSWLKRLKRQGHARSLIFTTAPAMYHLRLERKICPSRRHIYNLSLFHKMLQGKKI